MAWNGTVTCSECWKEGHNRNGCPRRKERYEAALAMPEEERGYSEVRVIRDFEEKKARNSTRKCSYCDTQGHNRRSCEILKTHMEHIQRQEIAFKKAFLEHVNEIGLSIGSLVKGSGDYVTTTPETLCVATHLEWDNITITTCHGSIQRFIFARPVSKLNEPREVVHFTFRAPESWPTGPKWNAKESRWMEENYRVEVVGPCTTEPIEPPTGWLTSTERVKTFFKDRQAWMWVNDGNAPDSHYSCEWWNLEDNQEVKESA